MTPAETFQSLVQAERARQDARWGPPDASTDALVLALVAILTEEARAVLEQDRENLRTELVQVAAVAQKFWEALR